MHRAVLVFAAGSLVASAMAPGAEATRASQDRESTEVIIALAVHSADAVAVADKPVEARVEAVWYGRGAAAERASDRMSQPVSSRAGTRLLLPPGPWGLRANAPGYWGEERQILVDRDPVDVTLGLWPAGTVYGRLAPPRGASPPEALWIFLHPAPGHASSDSPPPSKLRCPVDDRSWTCAVPAGHLDLRFQAAGYVPVFQWDATVRADRTLDLGTMPLVPGSSVYGWVETIDGRDVAGQARVRLVPSAGCTAATERERGRIEGRSFEAVVGERGFFDFGAVPPGAYVIEARAAPYATTRGPVQVVDGQPTQISNPPLVLDRPETLEVYLDPPTDPSGEAWKMALSRVVSSGPGTVPLGAPVAEGPAEIAGWWEAAGLERGRYRLTVRSGEALWFRDDLAVDDEPPPVMLDLHGVAAEGTVTLADEPLEADLTFQDATGAISVSSTSDDAGSFSVLFPHPGTWSAVVKSEASAVHATVRGLTIEPARLDRPSTVRIALHDTVLRGRVTLEDGSPAPDAIVQARSARLGSVETVTSERDGRFEIRGLADGTVSLRARSRGGFESQTVEWTVDGGTEGDDVELVLRRQLRVTGTVASAAGTVPGATVTVQPTDRLSLGVPILTTDARGRFAAPLPAGTGWVQVTAGAPGFALRMLHLPLPADGRLPIQVDQAAGTLSLDLGTPFNWLDPRSPVFTIRHGAAAAPLPALLRWAGRHGVVPESPFRHVEIPELEPGDYSLCWSAHPDRPAGAVELEAGCAAGTLTASGTLTLRRPVGDG